MSRLFEIIHAPDGAQLLATSTHLVEDILLRLSDEVGSPELRRQRDLARVASRLIARHPSFVDEGFLSVGALQAKPLYQVFCTDVDFGHWEQTTIRDALLTLIVLRQNSTFEVETLVDAFHSKVILPSLPVEETAVVARIQLLSKFVARHPRPKSSDMDLAYCLNIAAEVLSSHLPDSTRLQPSPINIEFIEKWTLDADRAGYDKTPADYINKLTVELATRLGASIRYEHMPKVWSLPSSHEIHEIKNLLSGLDEDQADWLLLHALLGQYASAILGRQNSQGRVSVEVALGGSFISISAPSVGSKANVDHGRHCLLVGRHLKLPLPRRLAHKLISISAAPDYSYEKVARAVGERLRQRGIAHGLSLRMKKLQRLLTARLDESHFDSTLQHLLGLTNLAPRDSGIYYFSPSTPVLVSRFKRAVTDLSHEFGRDDLVEGGWMEAFEDVGCFGVSIRPDPAVISRLICHLHQASCMSKGKPTPAARRRAFNAQAAYVTLLFLSGTGARPTGDVFPTAGHIDEHEGLALLSEKDSLLYRSTRIVRVPERLKKAIQKFTEYRNALGTASRRTFDEQMSVFLIDESGNPVPPSIANMKRHVAGLADFWTWPDDALRHHFRSRLWELGCPTDSIIMWMGHMGKSETPDNIFGSRPIDNAIASAAPFIEKLLDELGFR